MSSTSNLKYFVGGVPSNVRQKELYDFFRQYGAVKRVTVFNSDKNKKLFGFCFVKFKSVFGGELDLQNTEFVFQGRRLEIDNVIRRSSLKQSVQEKHSKRVFLQNVPLTFDRNDLMEIFSSFGPVANCFTVNRFSQSGDRETRKSQTESASNYGYVIFRNIKDAEDLLKRRFVDVNSKTRIYIKRYCSTLNRVTSEDQGGQQGPFKSVKPEENLRDSGATLSQEGKLYSGAEELQFHQMKPTTKAYHQGSTFSRDWHTSKLKFNISLL